MLPYKYYCNTKAQTQLTACTCGSIFWVVQFFFRFLREGMVVPHVKHTRGRQATLDNLPNIGTEYKLSHRELVVQPMSVSLIGS